MAADRWVNVIGVAAAACSMASFVPQLVKIWRDRDASAVSFKMFALTVTGFSLWIAYGLLHGGWPLVMSNAVCLALSAAILGSKIRIERAVARNGETSPAVLLRTRGDGHDE